MTQEQKERNLRLAEALESNTYQQGKGLLRCGEVFCCLGVACDLFHKETGLGKWEGNDYFNVGLESNSMLPPTAVWQWYGWEDSNPALQGVPGPELTIIPYAAALNDRGASFAEIAAGFRTNAEHADPPVQV